MPDGSMFFEMVGEGFKENGKAALSVGGVGLVFPYAVGDGPLKYF